MHGVGCQQLKSWRTSRRSSKPPTATPSWLSSSEAAARGGGPNELLDHPGHSVLQLVAQQFKDTLVRIPLAAGAVSFALALSSSAGGLTLSAFIEPLVIFLILVVNAAVGV
ncbi:hypothetical protein ZWY2020_020182 [Hordeum vulgare]|nr:hypothetical protein ZWY2020_020182 [Hordeum vulgare]